MEMEDSASGKVNANGEVTCFEKNCETEIAVVAWDDTTPSGRYLPACPECSEERPEFNLWDVSVLERGDASSDAEELTHPIPDGEDWVVRDKSKDWMDKFDESFGTTLPRDEQDPEPCIEIYLRDPTDTDALKEARDEARRRLDAGA